MPMKVRLYSISLVLLCAVLVAPLNAQAKPAVKPPVAKPAAGSEAAPPKKVSPPVSAPASESDDEADDNPEVKSEAKPETKPEVESTKKEAAPALVVTPPPADADEPQNHHYLRGGLMATNTYYIDPVINPGLFAGFYRPFAKYAYNEKYSATARGLLTVKHYIEPIGALQQTKVTGSVEILAAEAKYDRHTFTAGRSFYMIEQGLLFANFADGFGYTGRFPFGQLRGFATYSAEYGAAACVLNVTGCNGDPGPFVNTPNLLPDSGVQNSGRRIFFAAEYYTPEYLGAQATAYALYSRDMISEDASRTKYAYHPWYGGLGLRGYIVNSNLRYRADMIYQGGSTYNLVLNGVSAPATISAMAALVNFTYNLPVLTQYDAQLTAEVAAGSGDADASRMTNASQSNTDGSYTAFHNFGSFSGGLALKPRLANLQVVRLGTYFRPLKPNFALRNLAVQLKYSYYRKSVATGGISDPAATEASSDVGHAGDLAVTFNPMADLQFFWGFGVFRPGSAYPVLNFDGTDGQAWRYAHLVSLTLIF